MAAQCHVITAPHAPASRDQALGMIDREKLFEAVENLRAKLLRLAMLLGVLTAVGYWQAPLLAAFLQQPSAVPLVYYAPGEAFLTNIKLGFFAAVFVLAPVIFLLLWNDLAAYITP